ncbi:hypothetical protein G9E11_15385 [Arthrobacter sp. IA7]|uniref:hypothetical protein n=1 Tax=Arthrobacter ipis TaxID=2716202 RepID=UPI001688D931|nr:hypothetical protein [Arthrobacter ipis]MBD1543594.1 hypothetical protein [Arthrobacter ipis]
MTSVQETASQARMISSPAALRMNSSVASRIRAPAEIGLATSAFSAAIAEHAPAHRKKLAEGLAGASVAGDLGICALMTGAAVQFTPDANTLIFGILTAVMVLGILL